MAESARTDRWTGVRPVAVLGVKGSVLQQVWPRESVRLPGGGWPANGGYVEKQGELRRAWRVGRREPLVSCERRRGLERCRQNRGLPRPRVAGGF